MRGMLVARSCWFTKVLLCAALALVLAPGAQGSSLVYSAGSYDDAISGQVVYEVWYLASPVVVDDAYLVDKARVVLWTTPPYSTYQANFTLKVAADDGGKPGALIPGWQWSITGNWSWPTLPTWVDVPTPGLTLLPGQTYWFEESSSEQASAAAAHAVWFTDERRPLWLTTDKGVTWTSMAGWGDAERAMTLDLYGEKAPGLPAVALVGAVPALGALVRTLRRRR